MIKQILTFFTLSLVSCSSPESAEQTEGSIIECANAASVDIEDPNIEFVFEYGISYKYDLTRQTYKIMNMRGDTTINFSLTSQERIQITEK